MRVSYILFNLAVMLTLISCQTQKKEDKDSTKSDSAKSAKKTYHMDNEEIKKHMELQEHIEASEDNSYSIYKYTAKDVEIALPIIAEGLKEQNFIPLNQKDFEERIKTIFGDIFYQKNSKVRIRTKFNTVFVDASDNDSEEFDYTIDNIFISKEYRFITYVPLIGDFITFLDSAHYKIEINPPLVSRNKYLFNNSRPDLAYLLHEDTLFLKTLVTSFGYTKEPKINDLVMNDYLDMDDKHMATVGEIIFVKNGTGELVIKEELLKWIADHTSANDIRMLLALDTYGSLLFDSNQGNISKTSPFNLFTPDEKRKIVAYIGSIYEPLFNKFSAGKAAMWPGGSAFENLLSTDDGFEPYLRQHHYFSLTALKNILEPSE